MAKRKRTAKRTRSGKSKSLPKQIYVQHYDPADPKWLLATPSVTHAACHDAMYKQTSQSIGVYVLKELVKLKPVVKVAGGKTIKL